LTASTPRGLWKNEYLQTAIMILFIIAVVFGFWYGSRYVLNTEYPMLAVASGSMCMLPGPYCDGWSHPFERTLHVGDLIIVQGVNVSDIYAAPYPNGTIIVFHQLYGDELIVHRAIQRTVENGLVYYVTKGDGNSLPDQPIPADNVVGKVILRIPYIGWLALWMRDSTGIYLILGLIAILIIVELILPIFRDKKPKPEKEENPEKTPET
jgi:signal peptidase I